MNSVNDHIDTLITRYLDRTASEQETTELLQWVKSDAQNKAYFQAASRQFVALTSTATTFNAPGTHNLNAARSVGKTIVTTSKLAVYSALVAACTVAGALVWWFASPSPDDKSQNNIPVVEQYRGTDTVSTITLPDSVFLTLDAHALVTLTKATNEHTVAVRGKVLIDIRSPKQKFTIMTPSGRCALGEGQFQVEQSSDSVVNVSVVSGTAQLKDSASASVVTLLKAELATVKKGQATDKTQHRDQNYLAWKTGVLEFDNTPLRDAVPLIARYYKKTIVMETPGLDACLLNAKLDRYTFAEVKTMFEIAFQAQFVEENEVVTMKGKGCGE